MAFEIRSEIMTQISKTQDEHMRVVLLLLLGVLEASVEQIRELGEKIDDLRTDEATLSKTVLNGLAPTHHDDHIWLNDHRKFSEANQELIDQAKPLMAWVAQQMEAEAQAKANRKTFAQKVLEGAAGQIGTIAVTALVTYLGFTAFKG